MVTYEFTARLRTYGHNKEGITTLTLTTDLLSHKIGKRLTLDKKLIRVRIMFDDGQPEYYDLDELLVLNRDSSKLPGEAID